MIVVAVEDFDIDAGIGHPARQLPQLAWHSLLQTLDDHLSHSQHPDTNGLECLAGRSAVSEEEMGGTASPCDPCAATLDADTGATQCFAHVGEGAGMVVQDYRYVLHGRHTSLYVVPLTVNMSGSWKRAMYAGRRKLDG
jgi:hypothetical protein